MTIPTVTALPDAPTRADSATFDTRADAFMPALVTLATEINATVAATNLATAQVTEDAADTAADAIATAADRVQTGLDAADTAADAIATAADRVQTGLDAIATAADRVQTGEDAAAAAASAAAASAVTGIPEFGSGDAGKVMKVNAGGTGYDLGSLKTVNGEPILGSGGLTTDKSVPLAEGTITTGACDYATGYVFSATISGDTTISLTNTPASGTALIILRLTNGGSATVTWPASIKWPGGTAPTLTASGLDEVVLMRTNAGVWSGAVRKDVK